MQHFRLDPNLMGFKMIEKQETLGQFKIMVDTKNFVKPFFFCLKQKRLSISRKPFG